jgi:hypothetical protein
MADLIVYRFNREAVEEGDCSDFLRRFGPTNLPKGKALPAMMNSLVLTAGGFDDDPREIYSIPAVRSFYQRLQRDWPYALFFCSLDTEELMMFVLCCLETLDTLKIKGQSQVRVSFEPWEVGQWIAKGFAPMNELCEAAGCTERQIYDRTEALFRYFQLPFDVPPPQ